VKVRSPAAPPQKHSAVFGDPGLFPFEESSGTRSYGVVTRPYCTNRRSPLASSFTTRYRLPAASTRSTTCRSNRSPDRGTYVKLWIPARASLRTASSSSACESTDIRTFSP
jgi:hypothetical protein